MHVRIKHSLRGLVRVCIGNMLRNTPTLRVPVSQTTVISFFFAPGDFLLQSSLVGRLNRIFQFGVGKRHVFGLPHLIGRDFPVANAPFRIQGLPMGHLLHAFEIEAFRVKRLSILLEELVVVFVVLFVSSDQLFQVDLVRYDAALVGVDGFVDLLEIVFDADSLAATARKSHAVLEGAFDGVL